MREALLLRASVGLSVQGLGISFTGSHNTEGLAGQAVKSRAAPGRPTLLLSLDAQ